jgi:hypothetical protein
VPEMRKPAARLALFAQPVDDLAHIIHESPQVESRAG